MGTPGERSGKDVAEQFVCQPLGSASAVLNIAAAASASASSTLDPGHGASLTIDGLASTYWVSKMDVAEDVTLLLDFGEAVRGSVLELDFEFAPSAFAVQAASPAAAWRQIFATDSNVLKHVPIPREAADMLSRIKLVMQIAHVGVFEWTKTVRRPVS